MGLMDLPEAMRGKPVDRLRHNFNPAYLGMDFWSERCRNCGGLESEAPHRKVEPKA